MFVFIMIGHTEPSSQAVSWVCICIYMCVLFLYHLNKNDLWYFRCYVYLKNNNTGSTFICMDDIYRWLLFNQSYSFHDDVIKWKHFPRYWPFVRVIHRSPVNYPHKDQWRGALMFSSWINGWVNNGEAGDLMPHRIHYDVIVMCSTWPFHEDTLTWQRIPHYWKIRWSLMDFTYSGPVMRRFDVLFDICFKNSIDRIVAIWQFLLYCIAHELD